MDPWSGEEPEIVHPSPIDASVVRKTWFVSHIKHTKQKINRSTSFAIDNIYYVNFRIKEQESVYWCGEIQNQRLEVFGNTFNLHSNFACAQEV